MCMLIMVQWRVLLPVTCELQQSACVKVLGKCCRSCRILSRIQGVGKAFSSQFSHALKKFRTKSYTRQQWTSSFFRTVPFSHRSQLQCIVFLASFHRVTARSSQWQPRQSRSGSSSRRSADPWDSSDSTSSTRSQPRGKGSSRLHLHATYCALHSHRFK